MDQILARAWQQHGIRADAVLDGDANLVELFQQATARYGDSPAVSSLGHTLSFTDLGRHAADFAAYLQQHTDLQPGDRIAIQLPNLIQYPVVLFGAMMAGLVVVNTNPLYQPRELLHQLQDSGARAIVVLANIADTLQQVLAESPVQQVIVTELADLHPWPRRTLINAGARYIKRMVPRLDLPSSLSLKRALQLGQRATAQPASPPREALAILQYTGGTTGVAKGAMLSHRNLLANVRQCETMLASFDVQEQGEVLVLPLPLYHIYSFINVMLMLVQGNHAVLIPNPRQVDTVVEALANYPVTAFCGINTLFVSLCRHPGFRQLDFSRFTYTLSGGMALTLDAAEEWRRVTGCEIYQGYGLTETSPVVSVNPATGNQVETIGLAVPGTEIKLVDDDNRPVAPGERGELCVRGPQVMEGYWQRPEATAEVIDSEGFFHTGDIAIMQPDGFMRIVDRKKDMILVSGFNVYPNELEAVVSELPQVVECAAVGVPDDTTGEAIKLFVVVADPSLDAETIREHCREKLTGYKQPRFIEFIEELPKSPVGKILRRELR